MEVSSNPRHPSAIAEVGDFAVRQNTSDRSNPALNQVMDGVFKPVHVAWGALWSTQQQKEITLGKRIVERNAADEALDDSVGKVLRSIRYQQGEDSPLIDDHVPGGNLEATRRPLAVQVSTLAPYAERIGCAPDDVIAPDARADFAAKYGAAKEALAAAEAAEREATEAQMAREMADAGWFEAYGKYHRQVEHEMEDDVKRIEGLILRYPKS